MAHLKRRRIVQFGGLAPNGFDDLRTTVAGVHAPESRGSIEDLTAVVRGVVHSLGLDQHARGLLELAIRGEGHPEGVEIESGCRGHGVGDLSEKGRVAEAPAVT